LIILNRLLSPLILVLEKSTQAVLKLLFFEFGKGGLSETQEIELDDVSHQTRSYVLNLIKTEKKTARDVMVPWKDVSFVERNMSTHEIETAVLNSLHSRLPIVDGDNIVGMIHTKELLASLRTDQTQWEKIIRPALRVPAHSPIMQILLQMQEKRLHLGVVFEQMKYVGIITLEDILEEVVGDIEDEGDDGSFERILQKTARLRLYPKPPSR
jgi:putative hemolysin